MISALLHVGIGVEDLEASVKFYTEVMQMEEDYRTRNVGPVIDKIVGVENADINVAVVKMGDLRLELLDYQDDEAKAASQPKNQNHTGLIHLAFAVEDIDAEYERIKALGYKFNAPPQVARPNGPKIAYFHGPDHVVLELFEKVS